ncbi:MAG: RluA family pseudouridine synthase [Parachlamydiaceae bacterium]|nr:RluA family pseudouridine synthase [Parachlamydiaceae bacterium]
MHLILEEDTYLLDVLIAMAPQCSKTTLRSWLKDGRVTVDGGVVKVANTLVTLGQKVCVESKPQLIANKIRVIYEDNDLIAVEKPTGMLSVSTAFETSDTVFALLKAKFRPRTVYVVHRLDQDTSGVMLFALSEKAFIRLKEIFAAHDIERKYCAIVEGHMTEPKGSWQSYLYEDANYKVHTTDDPEKGRLAITHFKTLNSTTKFSRLELTLETGRKNQIRVHCRDAGHAVVGDKKYGSSTDPIKRVCLHAFLLALNHPVTEKPLRFTSPIPSTFDRLA